MTRRDTIVTRAALVLSAVGGVAWTLVGVASVIHNGGVRLLPGAVGWTLLYLALTAWGIAAILAGVVTLPIFLRWMRHRFVPWITAADEDE